MLKRSGHVLILAYAIQGFLISLGSYSEARDLTDVLGKGLDAFAPDTGEPITVGARVAPSLAAAVAQAVTQELPLASVAPAFAYRYNLAVDAFERSTNVPGPLFSERALTLGEKQLNFGVGYAFVDFSELNGTDLNNIQTPGLVTTFSEAGEPVGALPGLPPLRPGETLFLAPVFETVDRIRLDLQAHIITPTLRYGLTDRWDVGLSIPIVNTSLRIKPENVPLVEAPNYLFAYVRDAQGSASLLSYVDPDKKPIPTTRVPFVKSQIPIASIKSAGSATGVGDIILRSKYRFWRTEEGGAALGLILQLPSGEKKDFHGTGETHLSTLLYLSQVLWKRVEPHLNIGIDFNADDVDRSSFLYTAGATMLVGKKLGLVIDFLGRSEFTGLRVRFPPSAILSGKLLSRPPNTCTTAQPCFFKPKKENPDEPQTVTFALFPEKIRRNDIANFSFGLRYVLGESGSIFFGGIVPLNEDGFRADFIPTGGIEYTF
jgi:hypothetical protein